METVKIQHFSDLLCVWAYVAQVRIDELEEQLGESVSLDCHFIEVFGDTRGKIEQRWADRGGAAAYASHVRAVADGFDHVDVHPDIWVKNAPTSSLTVHVFLCAVRLLDDGSDAVARAAWAARLAFFRDLVDISDRAEQLRIAESVGLSPAKIEQHITSGRAHAELARDQQLVREQGIRVSPTLVFNEGRQHLNGNVGYRVIEANVRELLRSGSEQQSWC